MLCRCCSIVSPQLTELDISHFLSKSRRWWFPGAVVFVCFAFGRQLAHAQVVSPDDTENHAPSRATVERAIELATGYLERACGPDGKFAYKVEIGSGRENSSYDIIRHEGAMYALAMANHHHPDPKVVDAMVRAADFLRKSYLGPGVRPDQLAVWSKPLRTSSDKQYAELGGSGLGLVALAGVREVRPDAVPLSDLQALGRFMLFLQKGDGSFVHKYRFQSGPVTDWQSLYYPGEAALGLVALYEADHSNQWLDAAGKALGYLAKSRAALPTVPADHWALIATAKLFPYADQVQSTVSRSELLQHAMQICESILREQFRSSEPQGLDGAFDAEGRTAPAATRLEGLLAALEFLPDSELRERTAATVKRGIRFLLRAQISTGAQAGGMPGATVTRSLDSGEIRIDYVQHALCAWLRFDNSSGQKSDSALSLPFDDWY